MKCNYCANYMSQLDICKFCNFEYEEFYTRDDWDILNLNDDEGWSHLQILERLHSKGIECLRADIWFGDNFAYLIGVKTDEGRVAEVLKVHEDCIYNDIEFGVMYINLFQEKAIRLGINIEKEWDDDPVVIDEYYKDKWEREDE